MEKFRNIHGMVRDPYVLLDLKNSASRGYYPLDKIPNKHSSFSLAVWLIKKKTRKQRGFSVVGWLVWFYFWVFLSFFAVAVVAL